MRTLLLTTLFALTAAAQTVNYSGKWLIEQPGRGGRPQQSILALNQVGTEVTGTLGARYSDSDGSPIHRDILDGKVEGGVLSFYIWTGQDKPVKAFYKGTMSGETIDFAVTGAAATGSGAPAPQSRQLAKRTK
jgi:hypothetical protein